MVKLLLFIFEDFKEKNFRYILDFRVFCFIVDGFRDVCWFMISYGIVGILVITLYIFM